MQTNCTFMLLLWQFSQFVHSHIILPPPNITQYLLVVLFIVVPLWQPTVNRKFFSNELRFMFARDIKSLTMHDEHFFDL